MKRGFSLVELSIVLVILGLLTGGILAGQSLIRAAELRAVSSEYQRYSTAINSFRDKYFAVPGDFRDATKFWDRNVTNGWCVSNSGKAGPAANGTCDGNGDGNIDSAAAAQSGEVFQLWRQLALAGLIEGTYSGLSGAGAAGETVANTNAPGSRLSSGIWYTSRANNFAGDAATFGMDYGNFLYIGGAATNSWPIASILKPEEAWNIDTKIDDGRPGYGKVIPRNISTCTTTAVWTTLTADYLLTSSNVGCALHFRQAY